MRRDDPPTAGPSGLAVQVAGSGDCGAAPGAVRDVGRFFADDGCAIRRALIDAIKRLPDREQYVMSMFYEHSMELNDIARVLGVTGSRVCQIKAMAIAKLRAIVLAT